jgi:hypothetical protein
MGTANQTGFRFVEVYNDRYGTRRIYFKRGGKRVALPSKIGSPAFLKAYQAALDGTPVPERMRQSVLKVVNPSEPKVGVYLLLLKGEVVYIGSSLGMQTRVAQHRSNGRPFDQVFYIGTTMAQRTILEHTLIAAIRPKQNRNGLNVARSISEPSSEIPNRPQSPLIS